MENKQLVEALRELAKNEELIWNVARFEIENVLVEMRDARIAILRRNNGLVINERDGSPSTQIRLCPEDAMRIGLEALADHFEKLGEQS